MSGFFVNLNGGHSDGSKTAKLQVVQAVDARSEKTVQAKKSGIFLVKKQKQNKTQKHSSCNNMFYMSLNQTYYFRIKVKSVSGPLLSSSAVSLVPMIHFY